MKKYDEAISDFRKTISLNPVNASSYDDLGYMYLGNKDYQNAAANFNKCISLDGKNFDAMLGIAIAYYNLGNLKQVQSSILQAIAVEPRLAEGMAGIENVEKEGYIYTDEDKRDLKKIFQIMGKTAPRLVRRGISSPLHLASQNGHLETVRLLLAQGNPAARAEAHGSSFIPRPRAS
jgi:tetratricopeptide (TPR) repeat protein